MITRATLIQYGTGREVEVEIWQMDRKARTAQVSQWNYIGSGCWWDFAPRFEVDLSALVNIRALCGSCGAEFDPEDICRECGWDWRKADLTDEQDSEQTRQALAYEYMGG